MNEKKYKIIVAYDGTDYAGWQPLTEHIAVANVVQNTFLSVFNKTIKVVGASRTDAGVHALGQVASFSTDLAVSADTMLRALNNVLPPDIVIRSLQEVASDFHPQRNVIQKTYWYHFFNGVRPLPLIQRYGYFVRFSVDRDKLQAALQIFIGIHDFRSFCSGWDVENTIRTIDDIQVIYLQRFNMYRIVIKGPGFLRYMIRRIVGACLEVASRKHMELDLLSQALAEKNPEQTLPMAPAKGLLLYKIRYKS